MLTDRQKQFVEACKDYSRLSVVPLSKGGEILEVFCKERGNDGLNLLYDEDLCAALITGVLLETFPEDTEKLWKIETIRFTDAFGCWVFHVHIQ